jgi:hypothetical protein
MTKKQPAKKVSTKVRASPKPEEIPLGSISVPDRAAMELTESELAWLNSLIDRIEGPALRPEDFENVKKGLGASIGYSHLQMIMRDIESWSSLDEWTSSEILYYLRIAQTGYKLALGISHTALSAQQKLAAQALIEASNRQRGGRTRWESDPKGRAMFEIRAEWERRQRPGGAFARLMARKFQEQGVDISEGGIKNAIARWRASSSS